MLMHLDTIYIKGWYFRCKSTDPEWYNVYYGDDTLAGSVRLKNGYLLAVTEDTVSPCIYAYCYEDKTLNSFETDVDRMYHLNLIAYQFDKRMQEISYGYS